MGLRHMGSQCDFLHTVQSYIAVQAIGPSSLRNQGSPGVIRAAREFLSELPLSYFPTGGEREFSLHLDEQTDRLLRRLPKNAQNWGAARKALNLFLRDALYNQYLASEFNLHAIEPWLEIPLDRAVARGLRGLWKKEGGEELPDWPGLKKLTPSISSRFQSFANNAVKNRGYARVHLDIYLWLEERKKTPY
jgi:hypothetical protein